MPDRGVGVQLLRALGALIPGDYLRTAFYLNVISKPRAALRQLLLGFYRMDHVYVVLRQARTQYGGQLSVLEFGTHDGYAFTKLLYATRYLGLSDRVTVHAFDSFEGMPLTTDRRDRNVVEDGDAWTAGQYRGRYEELVAYCRLHYRNFAIHRGLFQETLTPALLSTFERQLPLLVWVDCDYYSSARTVIERLVPYLPSGCVVYFDEYDLNYGSRLTGEARVVHELNEGAFGEGIELVIDRELSWDRPRVYRFIRLEGGPHYTRLKPRTFDSGRRRRNGSPLP